MVPVTFEELQDFVLEQERIVTKRIKNDASLGKSIEKAGIELKKGELDSILNRINRQIRSKYKIRVYSRQARFQIIQQIIQLEREKKKEKLDNKNSVNTLLTVLDRRLESIDPNTKSVVLNENILSMVEELSDSNILETNDVELIDHYDQVRNRVVEQVRKINRAIRMNEEVESLKQLLVEKTAGWADVNGGDKSPASGDHDLIEHRINQEIERMASILASIKPKT